MEVRGGQKMMTLGGIFYFHNKQNCVVKFTGGLYYYIPFLDFMQPSIKTGM